VKLRPKHKRFVAEYLVDLNATKAAIRAGYSEKWAWKNAARLTANEGIARAIHEGQAKRLDKLDISAERVLREIALLAFSNMDDYTKVENGRRVLETKNLTRDQMASVQELTEDATGGTGDGERRLILRTRFKLSDKGINLERLGRHLKLFTDKMELSGDSLLIERLAAGRKRLQEGGKGG